MTELRVVAAVTSDDVHDPDTVPMYSEGVCRYWGAFEDSPIPNVRLFVVYNREPLSDEEAFAVAKRNFGE